MRPVFYIIATVVTILILYCFISLAYVKRRKNTYLDMQENLRVGDPALIGNAIYGKITALDKDTVKLEIASGVVVTADRAAVFGKSPEHTKAATEKKD